MSGWLDDVDHLTGSLDLFKARRATQPCSVAIEGRVLTIERERRLRVVLRAPWHLLRAIELDLALAPEPAPDSASTRRTT